MMRLSANAKRKGYWLYRHVVPWPLFRLRDVEILSDGYDPALVDTFTSIITRPEPTFIGRIGGSDFDIATQYVDRKSRYDDPGQLGAAIRRVRELNGYFDFAEEPSNFFRYLDTLVDAYRASDALLYCNEGLITKFRYNVFEKRDMRLLSTVCRGKQLIDYTFVEAVRPFLASFSNWGEGKRILIVSPFSRSLEYQNARRDELLIDYRFPEFELLTYNTPVTYNSDGDNARSMGLHTRNWHEQCELMANEIASLDFDIAWFSCASYGMYLGQFVRNELGRSSVYMGGILNVLFNIYGQRYDTPYFNSLVNPETQIDAFENEDVASLKGGRANANESLGAYFGRRNR